MASSEARKRTAELREVLTRALIAYHVEDDPVMSDAEYDRRYEKSRLLPDGPERDRLYREMTRQMEVDAVWLLTDSRYRNVLLQPHVVGFRQHPVLHQAWRYIDMQPARGK